MTLPLLEPREGVLIARAGEAVICPECGEVLASFGADLSAAETTAGKAPPESITYGASHTGHPGGFRCKCGGDAMATPAGHYLNSLKMGPRLFIRSGSWTGWRGLGE
jgi:hypothetical protein